MNFRNSRVQSTRFTRLYYLSLQPPFFRGVIRAGASNKVGTYVSAADLRQGRGWVSLIHFSIWKCTLSRFPVRLCLPKDRFGRRSSTLFPHADTKQVSLLAGADFWRTVPLPHRGIPSIKTTDGPNGARGQYFKNGTPVSVLAITLPGGRYTLTSPQAALFPCGVSLAATWNLDLIHEVGQHLAAEAKARGANVLLAPTVCMHRSPLGGRNFESFSEDPFLTGKLAAAYIRGLQSNKVAATIKHFVCNEQETHRMNVDSVIQERPLREIYLKPFEIALRESSPWALMSSYNLLNGVHADMNEFTLKKVLRDEWKYDG